MNCKDIDELMTAYLDGEVAHEKQEQIEAHISTCPHCREELKTLSATQDNLRLALKSRVAGSAPSPNVWERILERIKTEERPVATSWRPLRTRLKAIKDIVAGIMFLRQPIWKTVLASALAVALIAGLSTTLPSIARLTDEALAKEIALGSSVVLEATGGKEITEANSEFNIVYIEDNTARVEVLGKSLSTPALHTTMRSWWVSLEVDLVSEKVTHYFYQRDNVTDKEAEQVLSILKADSRTGALLDKGAEVSYTGGFIGVTGWGHARATSEIQMIEEKQLTVGLGLSGQYYEARVDLIRGKVLHFGNPMFSLMTDEEIEEILNILKTDPAIQSLFEQGAVIRGMSKYMVSSTVVKEGEGPAELTAARVMVHMELGDKQYGADVDVIQGEVSAFAENLEYIRPQLP